MDSGSGSTLSRKAAAVFISQQIEMSARGESLAVPIAEPARIAWLQEEAHSLWPSKRFKKARCEDSFREGNLIERMMRERKS